MPISRKDAPLFALERLRWTEARVNLPEQVLGTKRPTSKSHSTAWPADHSKSNFRGTDEKAGVGGGEPFATADGPGRPRMLMVIGDRQSSGQRTEPSPDRAKTGGSVLGTCGRKGTQESALPRSGGRSYRRSHHVVRLDPTPRATLAPDRHAPRVGPEANMPPLRLRAARQ